MVLRSSSATGLMPFWPIPAVTSERRPRCSRRAATERYAVKALTLLPGQTLPEHWHPPIGDDPGKLETVRAVWGEFLLFLDGDSSISLGCVPIGKEDACTCRHEVVLKRGDQLTLAPGQKHWFQGGSGGAVVYSFSSTVRDLQDGFTDPLVVRKPADPE